jgi:Rps23 Pro-64 3,4-dihydroxylase Tpa1-like proline 4-hydroxylase
VHAAEVEELQPALQIRPHRSHREVKAETSKVAGSAARQILDFLASTTFLLFLRDLTDIPDLEPDESYFWAGIHVGSSGAFQAIHRDFRKHPVTGLFHRANVLVYLNSDWESTYGGDLELWPADMHACGRRIPPTAGRLVIFETSPKTLHGVPDPVDCPPGRARLSLASYYYSRSPGPDDRRQARFLRPKRPQDPWFMRLAGVSDGVAETRRIVGQIVRRAGVR